MVAVRSHRIEARTYRRSTRQIAVRKPIVIAGPQRTPKLRSSPITAHTTCVDHLRHSSLGHDHLQYSETSFPPYSDTETFIDVPQNP